MLRGVGAHTDAQVVPILEMKRCTHVGADGGPKEDRSHIDEGNRKLEDEVVGVVGQLEVRDRECSLTRPHLGMERLREKPSHGV